MNSILFLLTSYLVNSVWEVAVIGGAGWVVSRSVKRLGPQAQHLIWVATLALAVLAPATPYYRALIGYANPSSALQAHAAVLAPTASASVFPSSDGIVLSPQLVLLLSLFYLGALFLFAMRLAWLLHRTMAVIRRATPVALGHECEQLWQRSRRAFSIEKAALLRSPAVSGPVTAGFLSSVLLVPMDFVDNCMPSDFLAAMGHECAHIKRRDFHKNIFYEVMALLISFHPVTWIIKSQLAQTREMICDRMASEKLLSPNRYAQSLIRLATIMPTGTEQIASQAIGIFDTNTLEKRIMTIKTKRQRVGSALRIGIVVSATLLLLLVAAMSGALTRTVEAQTVIPSTKSDSAKKSRKDRTDLTCTYYDSHNIGYDGTCGTAKGNKKDYRCFLNSDKTVSQPQIGCEGKLKGR